MWRVCCIIASVCGVVYIVFHASPRLKTYGGGQPGPGRTTQHLTSPHTPTTVHATWLELQTIHPVFTITEKAPTRAFSWLKMLSHLRHY